MGEARHLTETEFRRLDFVLRETRVTATGETDVFRPEKGMEEEPGVTDRIEIRIQLTPQPPGDRNGQLSFDSMSVMDGDARLRLSSGNGRTMDPEMIEVVAWEMIEHSDPVIGYMEGRDPLRLADGRLAPIGHVLQHGDEEPEPETAQALAEEMAGP